MIKEEKIYLRTLCPKCSEFIDIEYVDEELQALRAWKAKARPFLYYTYAKIEKEDTISGTFPNDDLTKTLTELLGGSDE
jgi:hypothetical protein